MRKITETRPHKTIVNPHWVRDEMILALDCYFNLGNTPLDKKNLKIIELSQHLAKLPFHKIERRAKTFRNPDGVALTLLGIAKFDHQSKHKLKHSSKLAEEVWAEYSNNRVALHKTAEGIISAILKINNNEIENESDLEIFDTAPEGRVLTRIHSYRERKPENIEKKKSVVIKRCGNLECEACGFVFEDKYGELGKYYAECHHVIPLSELKSEQKPRIDELAIVCANCHRMIHRKKPWLTIQQLKDIIFKKRINI